jgi:multidrug efflux pump subunit AcrB
MSQFGMIGLVGIIVNDAVVFADKYNRNLKEGMRIKDAIFDAGISRFRPILLTSMTTVLGLYPLIFEKSIQARFLIPMAISVVYGVLIGTFFILVFFPALLMILSDLRMGAHHLWNGTKASREELEPAIRRQKKQHIE